MKKLTIGFLIMIGIVAGGAAGSLRWLSSQLPPLSRLQRIEPSIKTLFLTAEGDTLAEFYEENRILVPLKEISPSMVDALLAIEDRSFYDHWGLNLRAIFRAMVRNVEAGRVVQGGSTITQQLSRELFLTKEQTFIRKALEALVTLEVEKAYTKDEILEMYLNQIYFGNRSYGIEAAAQTFFGKASADLEVAECALLAGLPKSPRDYSPINYPESAIRRRNIVLQAMVETGTLEQQEADSLAALELGLGERQKRAFQAPYFVEYVRQLLQELFPEDEFRRRGLHVTTTLDLHVQRAAEVAMESHLQDLEKNWFFGENTRAKYLELEKKPEVPGYLQAAVVALEPETGAVLALVGGREYWESNYNRAVQAPRQPGSAFKPFVFTTAIAGGFRPSDTILDSPVVLPQPDGSEWRPQNYYRKYHGLVSLREVLAKSINLPSIKLTLTVGPEKVVEMARKFGISSPLRAVPSLALGSSEVNLLELTTAYSVFRNQGILVEPNPIIRIEDRNGRVLFEPERKAEEVIPASLAYVMTDMLEEVVNAGTATRRVRGKGWLGTAAGKTGTTDDYTDAWFLGFTPEIVVGVWVGFDERKSIGPGMAGSRAALPIWYGTMKSLSDSTNTEPFYLPPRGVTRRRICKPTGFLASAYCPSTREEVFLEGTAPQTQCHEHGEVAAKKDWIDFGGSD